MKAPETIRGLWVCFVGALMMLFIGAYDLLVYLSGGSVQDRTHRYLFGGNELLADSLLLMLGGTVCFVTSLWILYKGLTGDSPDLSQAQPPPARP
jgi:hypothetical protein